MAMASALLRQTKGAEARRPSALDAQLRLLIAGGGDERLWLDPITRRNRYGVPAAPAPDELWFSSSTASAVTERGWAAARGALERLADGRQLTIDAWFDSLRARLLSLYGQPDDEVVLSASGTEAELAILSLALTLAGGPLTNIVVGPTETGSGVPAAASGAHFLARASLGGPVGQGERLAGWERADIALRTVGIRTPDGALRAAPDIDQEAAICVDAAVGAGGFALLHVLDASKTGQSGVSRVAARQIAARHPGQVLVVVDACQLRCAAADIRRDLEDGFAVMLTGSKFAGGPPFCGALMLPSDLAQRLAFARPSGQALAPYSAALDWPTPLRRAIGPSLAHRANLGLGLRWSAALAEIEAFESLGAPWRTALLAEFDQAVRERVSAHSGLALVDPPGAAAPGLVPIAHADGSHPRCIYEQLASGAAGRPCHLGQPVAVGPRVALRVCASMPMIVDAAERGFAEIARGLDEIFEAWARLRA